MKLVSDFDGVWTLPHDEASAQGAWMDRTLASWVEEGERAAVAAWIADARRACAAEPARYGWAPGGRLSAYGDEDPFAPHSALLHYLALRRAHDPAAGRLAAAIEANGFDVESFGGHAHAQGVQEVARTRGPGILADAARAGHALLAAGVEVVVVSNSGTDKLARWFEHAGVPAVIHPARDPAALRLRGAARKFVLDPERRAPLELGALRIETARPAYEAVLREERPGAVVGDVFSLDLALPLALRRAEPAVFGAMRLFWLIRDYTPPWVVREIAAAAPEVERVEGGLVAVAERLGAAQRS